MVGAMVGTVRHAVKQREAGVDLIIAQGTEAAAHAGDISTMVLVPQVVAAVPDLPVLAAGGIANGRQFLAAGRWERWVSGAGRSGGRQPNRPNPTPRFSCSSTPLRATPCAHVA